VISTQGRGARSTGFRGTFAYTASMRSGRLSMRVGMAAIAALWLALGTACEIGGSAGEEPFAEAEELMAADRAFAAGAAARGAPPLSEVSAHRGLLYGAGDEPAVGPAAAGRSAETFAEEVLREPAQSRMLSPGELGYTVGHWWVA